MMKAGLPPQMHSDLSQQRQAYQQKMEAQLARWRAEIFTMEAEAEQAGSANSIAFQKHLAHLKTELQNAEKRLEKLKETTGDAWVEIQSDIGDTWQAISQSISRAEKELQHHS